MKNLLVCLCFYSQLIFAKEWRYLESEAFKMRYVVAADYMKDMDLVIEIGGYKTPITNFLPASVAAINIDPRSRSKEFDNKKVISGYYPRDFKMPIVEKYGVVLIGMELYGFTESDWDSLLNLLEQAEKVVIGYPQEWAPSISQHRRILENTGLELKKKVLMDFTGNDFGDLNNSWPPRSKRLQFYY